MLFNSSSNSTGKANLAFERVYLRPLAAEHFLQSLHLSIRDLVANSHWFDRAKIGYMQSDVMDEGGKTARSSQ